MESKQKAPFSIATTPRYKGEHYSFLWIVPLYLWSSSCRAASTDIPRHFSLSFIASGMSSGLHPVSSQSCCMYVRAGRPAFARPYVGVHRTLYCWVLTKDVSNTIFKIFGMMRCGIKAKSPWPLANTLPTRPMSQLLLIITRLTWTENQKEQDGAFKCSLVNWRISDSRTAD